MFSNPSLCPGAPKVNVFGPVAMPDGSVKDGAEKLLGPLPADAGSRLLMTTPILDPDDGRRFLGTLVGLFIAFLIAAV